MTLLGLPWVNPPHYRERAVYTLWSSFPIKFKTASILRFQETNDQGNREWHSIQVGP